MQLLRTYNPYSNTKNRRLICNFSREPNADPYERQTHMNRRHIGFFAVPGLGASLFLISPTQAQAATETLTSVPRTNATETGLISQAPAGAVFSITVQDIALSGGQET